MLVWYLRETYHWFPNGRSFNLSSYGITRKSGTACWIARGKGKSSITPTRLLCGISAQPLVHRPTEATELGVLTAAKL